MRYMKETKNEIILDELCVRALRHTQDPEINRPSIASKRQTLILRLWSRGIFDLNELTQVVSKKLNTPLSTDDVKRELETARRKALDELANLNTTQFVSDTVLCYKTIIEECWAVIRKQKNLLKHSKDLKEHTALIPFFKVITDCTELIMNTLIRFGFVQAHSDPTQLNTFVGIFIEAMETHPTFRKLIKTHGSELVELINERIGTLP